MLKLEVICVLSNAKGKKYMGLFGAFRSAVKDINDGYNEFKFTEGAKLVDVRSATEYHNGHIPGSINIPLEDIENIKTVIEDKSTPVFLYCLSGARSERAEGLLKKMHYTNAKNIGGIKNFSGGLVFQ